MEGGVVKRRVLYALGGAANYHLGVSLRNNTGALIKGQIHVKLDAIDLKGGRGFAKTRFPIDRDVPSGWEFSVAILPEQKYAVVMTITGTAANLPVGTLLSCWIRDEHDAYLAENWARVTPERPHSPVTATCPATVTPPGGGK